MLINAVRVPTCPDAVSLLPRDGRSVTVCAAAAAVGATLGDIQPRRRDRVTLVLAVAVSAARRSIRLHFATSTELRRTPARHADMFTFLCAFRKIDNSEEKCIHRVK